MPLCPPDPRRCPRLSYACETNGACRAFGRIGVDPSVTTRKRVALGFAGLGVVALALMAFRQHCTRSATEGIHMRNGPGFICLSVAVCLKGLSVLMHLWLRVPDVSDDDDEAPDEEESKDGGGEESK